MLVSLGGDGAGYSLDSVEDANATADEIWCLFLHGSCPGRVRPFGAFVMDGVELAIRSGTAVYYTDFVARLRERAKEVPDYQLFVMASPLGAFPDPFLGPNLDEDLYPVSPGRLAHEHELFLSHGSVDIVNVLYYLDRFALFFFLPP